MEERSNKKTKIAIVGHPSGTGLSKPLESILKERGLTVDDIVIIDSETLKDKEKALEILKNSEKPVFIQDLNFLIEEPRQEIMTITDPYKDFRKDPMYYPTIKEVEEYHPFSKFIGKGKRGKKGRGRF